MIFGYLFSIIFGGWILFAHFVQNNLSIYTSDRYYSLILIAGFVSIVIGIVGLVLNRSKLNEYNSPDTFTLLATLIAGILFSPILLIFSIFILVVPQFKFKLTANFIFLAVIATSVIFPTKGISPALAEERAEELNTVNIQGGSRILNNFAVSTDKYGIGDWLASMAYNGDPQFYNGKSVSVDGFIFRTANLAENEFFVARYTIRCCVADAAPVGLKVKFDLDDNFKIGDWVNIKGIFEVDSSKGYEENIIIPTEVNSIPVPEKQYIF